VKGTIALALGCFVLDGLDFSRFLDLGCIFVLMLNARLTFGFTGAQRGASFRGLPTVLFGFSVFPVTNQRLFVPETGAKLGHAREGKIIVSALLLLTNALVV